MAFLASRSESANELKKVIRSVSRPSDLANDKSAELSRAEGGGGGENLAPYTPSGPFRRAAEGGSTRKREADPAISSDAVHQAGKAKPYIELMRMN